MQLKEVDQQWTVLVDKQEAQSIQYTWQLVECLLAVNYFYGHKTTQNK